ncbi:MAG: M55 family metallopeptidase [Chloroflexi bacterium]|nr:M55 family metallopeptidase [Chloroflexota bacterium]
MKIYIMTDMEAVAGVVDSDNYCNKSSRYYERGRELTTLETNAAIEACLEAGATEILVVDGHGHEAIDPILLHPEAKLLAGRPIGYPFGCDDSFDAALSIGQHAKSNTDGGHLAHTGSFNVEELTINGVSVGEMGCNFLFASYFGVPSIFLSGDQAAADEAKALVPNIETAAVKAGLQRGPAAGISSDDNRKFNGAAIHLHPTKARKLIKAGVQRALANRSAIKPFWLEPPYELLSVSRPDNGVPARTARATADDLLELLRAPRTYVESHAVPAR